jgi:hypothetical protein
VIAATGVGILLSARIAYGIASYRALPGSLADVSRRFKTLPSPPSSPAGWPGAGARAAVGQLG